MHHPTDTPTGPAALALPLALVAVLAERAPVEGDGADLPRATELRTTAGNRGRRAARRRAMTVRG
ncbi:hypothetical protein OG782_20165 [Streptomyces sp. NBC_00876]|uniref:hypothetical protein n=1 Tax=Streptomyces sp. NBC_00876 TaxID=2975853 RepID=UPI00386747CF|nr:hypothetical protein OG782_20165 [Streptomyces sp. NBC_00876]